MALYLLLAASLLASLTRSQSVLPEGIVLELPSGPVPTGTNWTAGIVEDAALRDDKRSFYAMQIYVTSSNGTAISSKPGELSAGGVSNLGNATTSSRAWNETTAEFVTLDDGSAPYCTAQRGPPAGQNRYSWTWISDEWPADTYNVNIRYMVWTGEGGVQTVQNNSQPLLCIYPPISNYSVAVQAAVTFPTSTDAYGQPQTSVPSGGVSRAYGTFLGDASAFTLFLSAIAVAAGSLVLV